MGLGQTIEFVLSCVKSSLRIKQEWNRLMATHRVLVTDKLAEEGLESLRRAGH